MNKNHRKGLVYATVVVAALFVAVVSGTFAYFTASATNNSTVQGTISNVTLNLTITKVTNKTAANGQSLIPLDDTDITTAISSTNECVDSNGYTVCQVYKVSVNSGSDVIAIGTLNIAAANAPNIKWQLLENATTQLATPTTVNVATDGYLTATEGDTITSTTKDYYIVVWIENQNSAQTDRGNFLGTVTFEGKGENAGQVQAQFEVTENDEEITNPW